MGQKLFEDRIKTPTYQSSVITLPAGSFFTIGGQQYTNFSNLTVTLSGLAVNTLYMVYMVLNGGVPILVVSANVNSVGPAGYIAWKLVGAFYANGATTLGSFVPIDGRPATSLIAYSPSWGASVSETTAFWKRNGGFLEGHGTVKLTATLANNAGIQVPFTIDSNIAVSYVSVYGEAYANPSGIQQIIPTNKRAVVTYSSSNNLGVSTFSHNAAQTFGPYGFDTFFAVNDKLTWHFSGVPILGWSETPLKDL